MNRIISKSENEMKIFGVALASTIKVLAELGSLGVRVFQEHGVLRHCFQLVLCHIVSVIKIT